VTSAAREAVVLPAALLTIVLLGGVRLADTTTITPPSVYVLVLGLLLLRVVVQSGALAPERLVSSTRSALENLNGVVVLISLWLAAAQMLAALIPVSGLPRLVFGVFLLVLLLNTAASAPDRAGLLRTLAVTCGALFLLKFVVLAELSAPGTSRTKRVLQAMLEGVTLGTLLQPPAHAATAYVALFTLVLFLAVLCLLPARPPRERSVALERRTTSALERR
jgi:hypothetical protein